MLENINQHLRLITDLLNKYDKKNLRGLLKVVAITYLGIMGLQAAVMLVYTTIAFTYSLIALYPLLAIMHASNIVLNLSKEFLALCAGIISETFVTFDTLLFDNAYSLPQKLMLLIDSFSSQVFKIGYFIFSFASGAIRLLATPITVIPQSINMAGIDSIAALKWMIALPFTRFFFRPFTMLSEKLFGNASSSNFIKVDYDTFNNTRSVVIAAQEIVNSHKKQINELKQENEILQKQIEDLQQKHIATLAIINKDPELQSKYNVNLPQFANIKNNYVDITKKDNPYRFFSFLQSLKPF